MEPLRVVAQLLRGAVVADPAALEHVGGLRDGERDVRELLDQEDADAGRGDGLQRRDQSLDDHGREPERELVDEDERGWETSACASTTICCSPPESARADAFQRRSSAGNSSSA